MLDRKKIISRWVFILIYLTTSFAGTSPAFAVSNLCADTFRDSQDSVDSNDTDFSDIEALFDGDPESRALARDVEAEAIKVIRGLRLTNDEAKVAARKWFEGLRNQTADRNMLVVEHLTLQLILRTEYFADVDAELVRDVRQAYAQSWFQFTGKKYDDSAILNKKLPSKLLKDLPVQVQRFYKLAYNINPTTRLIQRPNVRAWVARALPIGLLAFGFSKTGGDILAGASIGYFLSLSFEYAFHSQVMHANKERRDYFRSQDKEAVRRLGNMAQSHFEHHAEMSAVKNPQRYIKKGENDLNDPYVREQIIPILERNGMSPEEIKAYVEETGHGITMEEIAMKNAWTKLMPLGMAIGFLMGDEHHVYTAFAAGSASLAFMPHVNLMHNYMHVKRSDIMENGTFLEKWFLNTRYFRMIMRFHYLHHVRSSTHYSILPMGLDQLLGTVKRPDLNNLLDMLEADIFF